jgi:hypothetical protein
VNNTETSTDAALRQSIAQALSRAGLFCGECGFQPGEDGCSDCRRHWEMCADELLPVFEEQRNATLTQAAELMETLGMDDASAQLRYQATPYTDDTAAAEGVR